MEINVAFVSLMNLLFYHLPSRLGVVLNSLLCDEESHFIDNVIWMFILQ